MSAQFVFCTRCAQQNPAMNEFCVKPNCGNKWPSLAKQSPIQTTYADASLATADPRENKLKASTVILIILGIVLPAWIITLPLCWYFAYVSYKKPWSF